MYYLLFGLDFMKDKGDNLSSQLRGKNFFKLGSPKSTHNSTPRS